MIVIGIVALLAPLATVAIGQPERVARAETPPSPTEDPPPPIDTYEAVKDMESSGFTEAQAAALTRTVVEAVTSATAGFATRDELQTAIGSLQADMRVMGAELRETISTSAAETESTIIRWLSLLIVGSVGVASSVTIAMLRSK